jgi:hypothetical protein
VLSRLLDRHGLTLRLRRLRLRGGKLRVVLGVASIVAGASAPLAMPIVFGHIITSAMSRIRRHCGAVGYIVDAFDRWNAMLVALASPDGQNRIRIRSATMAKISRRCSENAVSHVFDDK